MKISLRKRIKNRAFWIGIVSGSFIIARAFGLEISPEDEKSILSWVETTFNVMAVIGVYVGLINNPDTDNTGFSDD